MYGQETNQNNQPVAQPTLPAPQDPGFMQSNPEDLSFIFNEESGQLEIGKKQAIVPPVQDPQFQQVAEAQQTTQAQQAIDQQVPQSPVEQELAQLKGAFAQLVGYLQAKEQGQLNNLSQQPQQEQAPDYSQIDFQDPTNIVALINTAVANAVKQHIDPLNNAVNQVQVKNNFDMTAAKYGKDFLDVLPKINVLVQSGILKSDPNMSFENLYLAFKQIENLNGHSAKSDSTIQPVDGPARIIYANRQPQTVERLVQKANAISTESGGVQRNIINSERPKVNSVEDAVEAAWQQHFGGNR